MLPLLSRMARLHPRVRTRVGIPAQWALVGFRKLDMASSCLLSVFTHWARWAYRRVAGSASLHPHSGRHAGSGYTLCSLWPVGRALQRKGHECLA